MDNIDLIVLKELEEKGEIPNSTELLKKHKFEPQVYDGVLKSLLIDDYVNLINQELEEIELTEEGKRATENGAPEYILTSLLPVNVATPKAEIQEKMGSKDEFEIGVKKALQNKWIKATKTDLTRIATEIKDSVVSTLRAMLEFKNPKDHDAKILNELKKRKIVAVKKVKYYKITKGSCFSPVRLPTVADLTVDMLNRKSWESVKFKKFNVNTLGKEIHTGNLHPLNQIRDQFRGILLELGFEEMSTDTYVDTSFWVFDTLFTPQQHPARELQDTFFLKKPETCTSIPKELL